MNARSTADRLEGRGLSEEGVEVDFDVCVASGIEGARCLFHGAVVVEGLLGRLWLSGE